MGGSSSKSEGLQEEELIRKLRWVTIVTIVQHNRLTFAFPVVENTRTLWSCVEREYRSTREFLTLDLLQQVRNQFAEKDNTRKTRLQNESGSGLYFKLRKYNLPYPEAVFDGNYFRQVKYFPAGSLNGSSVKCSTVETYVSVLNVSLLRTQDLSMGWSGFKIYKLYSNGWLIWPIIQGNLSWDSLPHDNTQVLQSSPPEGFPEEDLHTEHWRPRSARRHSPRKDNWWAASHFCGFLL